MAELVYMRNPSFALLGERAIDIVVGIIELLLAIRFVLELLGASSGAPFIAWVYSVSWNLVAPFSGAFPSLSLGGNSLIDFSTILAMIVYAILGWLAIKLIFFLFNALV
jgi:YggT family protein